MSRSRKGIPQHFMVVQLHPTNYLRRSMKIYTWGANITSSVRNFISFHYFFRCLHSLIVCDSTGTVLLSFFIQNHFTVCIHQKTLSGFSFRIQRQRGVANYCTVSRTLPASHMSTKIFKCKMFFYGSSSDRR